MVKEVTFVLTGATPLLMHNSQLADPLNQWAKQIKELTGKRTKTDEDHATIAHLEFCGGLYMTDTGPYVAGEAVRACLAEAARVTKQGKMIERGLVMLDVDIPLLYEGPRTIDGLASRPEFREVRSIGVNGNRRVMRTRPKFARWGLEAAAAVDTEILNLHDVRAIGDRAGRLVGLLDGRRIGYGRFGFDMKEL